MAKSKPYATYSKSAHKRLLTTIIWEMGIDNLISIHIQLTQTSNSIVLIQCSEQKQQNNA